jgi:hypothetical protein
MLIFEKVGRPVARDEACFGSSRPRRQRGDEDFERKLTGITELKGGVGEDGETDTWFEGDDALGGSLTSPELSLTVENEPALGNGPVLDSASGGLGRQGAMDKTGTGENSQLTDDRAIRRGNDGSGLDGGDIIAHEAAF